MTDSKTPGKPLTAAQVLLAPAPDDPALMLRADLHLREVHRRRTWDAAVELAIRDDDFRKSLLSKLRDLGEGRPRRHTTHFDVLQVATFAELMFNVHAGSRNKAHLLKKPRVFEEIARLLSITPSQAQKRFYRARALGLLRETSQ